MRKISIVVTGLLIFCSGSQAAFRSLEYALAQTSTPTASAAGVPDFKDYPAPSLYTRLAAKLLTDSEFSRFYKTRLAQAMTQKPTFAGEYVVAGWGCGGGGCYVQSLVNKRTGKAIETGFQARNRIVDFAKRLEVRVGEEIKEIRIHSRLLVTRRITEEEPRQYFEKYYVVSQDRLKLLKKVQISRPQQR